MTPVYRILDGAITSLDRHGATPRLIAWALTVDMATVSRHLASADRRPR